MSTSWKVFIGVLVVVAGLFGFNYYVNSKNNSAELAKTETTETTPSPTQATNTVTSSINASTGLDQDLASIDAELKTLDTNSAQVDSSLSDKPVAQTE